MKTGTFLCWLFGHKFAQDKWILDKLATKITGWREGNYLKIATNYCVRCGIEKD